ncbi:MAG: DNA repair protein RecN [Bacteroidota bacterium]|nr:DNA repair protein RecN [Bacteroidota bacterium]
MIEKLYIKNYLIIKESEIEFSSGLNILTGETGAGKSIIIDALSLILGERADYSIINKNKDALIVEGHFNFKNNKAVQKKLAQIMENESSEFETTILRRELLKKGISRNFINDSLVNISDMKKLGDIIIDIHSQNEHQSLLNKETHIQILDNYCSKNDIFVRYKNEYNEMTVLIKSYVDLSSKKVDLLGRINFLDYELKEINNVNLLPEEDSQLENELNKLENIEDISLGLNQSLKVLNEDEFNAIRAINIAVKELKKISEFDDNFKEIIKDLENSYILAKESFEFLNKYQSELNFDNKRIEVIRNRLSSVNYLKKKYGLNINELIQKSESLQKELNLAENFDYELEQIFKKIETKKVISFNTAREIFELRKKKSKELEKNINSLLTEVGLEGAEFKVNIKNNSGNEDDLFSYKNQKEYLRMGSNGFNEIEFLIRTNKGSDFSPLKKSVSGGEISRIMLAIKTVLSEKDNIGILVFDEIDAGISGRIAQKVGKILKELSKTHQIICITHLPQIAAMSKRHFHVSKKVLNNETVADIKNLSDQEKTTEVAKLISGEQITESATKSALELIKG